jgi:phosphomevalonate kinase
VLIAGGYLILDPEQIGLVIALSARIHVVIQEDAEIQAENGAVITVTSPQFLNAQWKYKVITSDEGLRIENLYATFQCELTYFSTPESSNDYVRITISYVLAYLQLSSIPNIKITILADNDYYSQASSPTYDHLRSLPRFNPLHIPLSKANKTGLGSSAALITSLTASLLLFFTTISLDNDKRIIHNLAQAAHCAAQGKVGSGFDVASAVYGSCIYQRFMPQVVDKVLLDSEVYENGFREKLRGLVEKEWEMSVTRFELNPGLRVVMGDVSAGSATPSMVRSVLKWKASGQGAMDVWGRLGLANRRLIDHFDQLKRFETEDIVDELGKGIRRPRQSTRPQIYLALESIAKQFQVHSLPLTEFILGNSLST